MSIEWCCFLRLYTRRSFAVCCSGISLDGVLLSSLSASYFYAYSYYKLYIPFPCCRLVHILIFISGDFLPPTTTRYYAEHVPRLCLCFSVGIELQLRHRLFFLLCHVLYSSELTHINYGLLSYVVSFVSSPSCVPFWQTVCRRRRRCHRAGKQPMIVTAARSQKKKETKG